MAFFSRVREALKLKKNENAFNDLRKIPSVDSLPPGNSSSIRETGIALYAKGDSFYDIVDESKMEDEFIFYKPLKKTPSFSRVTQQVPDESDKENAADSNSNNRSSGRAAFESSASIKDSRFASTRFAREPPGLKVKVTANENSIFDDDDFFESLPASPSFAAEEQKGSHSNDEYNYQAHEAEEGHAYTEEGHAYTEEEGNEEAVDNLEFINVVFSKARHDRQGYVLDLLEQGSFEVNSRDAHGNTLLHICAQNSNRRLAAKILKRYPQANINARNYKSLTPLDFSDKYGFVKLSEWFINMGAVHGPSQRKPRQYPSSAAQD